MATGRLHTAKFFLAALLGSALGLSEGVAQPAAMPGEFVVKLKKALPKSMSVLQSQFQSSSVKVVSQKENIVLVKRPLVEASAHVLKSLSQSAMVELVEPNYIYTINTVPNDPNWDDLWGLHTIEVESAWELSKGSRDVVVAVIDTGVDYGISDLSSNIWTNEAEKNGQPNVDDDGNGYVDDIHGYDFFNEDADPRDDHGHGSHCAGTIGAEGGNGIGVVGVNWNVKIMAIKFLSSSGSGTLAAAVEAIDYATENGAQVMSNSWGGGGGSQMLKESIERANEAGILFVAAAGNSSSNNDRVGNFPSNYNTENMIAVAASNEAGDLAYFSSYGRTTVHLAAPGTNILSTTPGGLERMSGTSMATPHVAGVAALLMSYETDFDFRQVKERLLATATPNAKLSGKLIVPGVLNANSALRNLEPEPDPNDPSNWDAMDYSLSTSHPYNANEKQEWTIEVPGATEFALHFSRFDTEKNFDKLTFVDASGQKIETWSGSYDGLFSPVIKGDTVTIQFSSDKSIHKYGFDIDSIRFRTTESEVL